MLIVKFDQTGQTVFTSEVSFSIYVFFKGVNFDDTLQRAKGQWFREKVSPCIWEESEC